VRVGAEILQLPRTRKRGQARVRGGGTVRPAGVAYQGAYVAPGGRAGPSPLARCIHLRQGFGGSDFEVRL